MRLWALLAALLLGTLVLAGCSDKDGDGDDLSSTTSSTSRATTPGGTTAPPTTSASTPTQPPTGPPGEPDNTAPFGSIAAAPANATSNPRTLNFTLNGTDPDGDNIVWDLDFGDGNATNGATLPANASHQYSAAGLFNVTFTISDGRLQTTYNLTANVTAGGGGTPLTIEGSSNGIDPTAEGLPMLGGCLGGGADEPFGGNWHTLDTVIDGWAWTLSDGYNAWFLDAAGATAGDGTGAGTVPVGTTEIRICTADPANAPMGSYTFVATPP